MPSSSISVTVVCTDEADSVVGQDLLHAFAGLDAETALQGNRFRGHQCGRDTAACEAGGGLTTDQTAADHDCGVRVVGGHLQRDRVGVRTQGERGVGAGNIERDRRRARRHDEMPVRVALPACGDDFLTGDVDVVDGDTADEVDVVADEPAGAVQVALLFASAEKPFTQRGFGIGQRGVHGEDAHRDIGVLAAERLRRAHPRRSATDGDESWCRHISWVPLRGVRHVLCQAFVRFADQGSPDHPQRVSARASRQTVGVGISSGRTRSASRLRTGCRSRSRPRPIVVL